MAMRKRPDADSRSSKGKKKEGSFGVTRRTSERFDAGKKKDSKESRFKKVGSSDSKGKSNSGFTKTGSNNRKPTGPRTFGVRNADEKPAFRTKREDASGEKYGKKATPYSRDNKSTFKKAAAGSEKGRKYSSGHSRNQDAKNAEFENKPAQDSSTGKRPMRPAFSRNRTDGKPAAFKKREEGFKKPDYKKSSSKASGERSFSGAKKEREAKSEKRAPGKAFDKRFEKRSKAKEEVYNDEPETAEKVRLNRYISNAGICSRREADKLISTGLVSVNGLVITEMGYQVQPGDDVRFNGERLSREKKVYIIMNKPKDAITTLDDPGGRNTVMDVLGNDLKERIFPVGRLDRNTTGVLLLTNDGELAQRLMHPKYEVEKVYKATLNQPLKGEDLWQLSNGVELEDGFIKPDDIAYPDPKVKSEVGVQIHSGRNRIIHRMFEHLGYLVDKLDRVSYGGFVKTGLKRGEWRHLNDKELKKLKRMVKLG